MKYSDGLYQLIKSLSKQEKNYFRLFASGIFEGEGDNYLKLFNEIAKQASGNAEYDEGKIRTLIFSGKFMKNFSYHKNYLYNMILSSMAFYNREKKIYSNVINLIAQTRFLIDKLLYEQALKILLKAKNIATESEMTELLYVILNIEKVIYLSTLAPEEAKRKIDAVIISQKNALDIINSNLEFDTLYKEVIYLNRRSGTGLPREEDALKEREAIVNSELMSRETNAKSYQSRYMYKTILHQYYLGIEDLRNANKYGEEVLVLMENNFGKSENFFRRYLVSLNNLLNLQIRLKKYPELENTVLKMRNLEKDHADKITEKEKVFIAYSISVLMITKYMDCGEFEKLKDHISETIRMLDKYENQIVPNQRIILHYFLGTSNFVLGQYDKCIKWMGKIINSEKSAYSEDYQCHSRIVYLLSYYELKYFDSMEYVLKSTYHFMSKRKRVYKYENIILKYLRKSFRIKTEKELYRMFEEMKDELEKISGDKFEKNAFDTFNILFWLESKLKKIPLTEVLINRTG